MSTTCEAKAQVPYMSRDQACSVQAGTVFKLGGLKVETFQGHHWIIQGESGGGRRANDVSGSRRTQCVVKVVTALNAEVARRHYTVAVGNCGCAQHCPDGAVVRGQFGEQRALG